MCDAIYKLGRTLDVETFKKVIRDFGVAELNRCGCSCRVARRTRQAVVSYIDRPKKPSLVRSRQVVADAVPLTFSDIRIECIEEEAGERLQDRATEGGASKACKAGSKCQEPTVSGNEVRFQMMSK